jgi:hypothetical protein
VAALEAEPEIEAVLSLSDQVRRLRAELNAVRAEVVALVGPQPRPLGTARARALRRRTEVLRARLEALREAYEELEA